MLLMFQIVSVIYIGVEKEVVKNGWVVVSAGSGVGRQRVGYEGFSQVGVGGYRKSGVGNGGSVS